LENYQRAFSILFFSNSKLITNLVTQNKVLITYTYTLKVYKYFKETYLDTFKAAKKRQSYVGLNLKDKTAQPDNASRSVIKKV